MSDDIKKILKMITESEDLEFDAPEKGQYSNEPDVKVLDFQTQADSGDDLHKKTRAYKNVSGGNNPMSIKEAFEKLQTKWKKTVRENSKEEVASKKIRKIRKSKSSQ